MIALVPFFHFIGGKRPWDAFFGGYFTGMIWTVGTLYWIGWATVTGLIGVIIVLPIFFGGISWLLNWLIKSWGRRALWIAPFVWTGMEIMQSAGEIGFPWNQLANSQTNLIPFIQFASIFGAYGVGFWIVFINVLIFMLIRYLRNHQPKFCLFITFLLLLVLVVPWIYGEHVLKNENDNPGQDLQISLIQGNIDPYKKWTPSFVDSNFVVYEDLTLQTQSVDPGLIVWPETATPCYLRYRFQYLLKIRAITDRLKSPILTGSPDYEWNEKGKAITYNSALLIQPERSDIQRYYKKHLVPFSERIPGIDMLPFIYKWLSDIHLDVGNYTPGDSVHVFHVDPKDDISYRFGTAICYDSVFPFHVRDLVKKGAQFIVIITNDGWFGHTSGPYQHASIAVLRAIETHRWVARCANTGISGFIDPYGRYQQKSKFNHTALLHQTIFLKNDNTLFILYGMYFKIFVFVCNIVILVITVVKRIKMS